MTDAESAEVALFPERVGDKLRAARTAAGYDLSDIATRTRIPLRHLVAIEGGDYAALPSITYAVGFVKAYARTVGGDEVALAKALRGELGQEAESHSAEADDEVADPARIPPKWLAWSALLIVLLFAGGYGLWRNGNFDGGTSPVLEALPAPAKKVAVALPAAKPATAGPVTLTARDDVWFRVYDKNDKVLYEGVKKKGEAYTVPADADTPMIRTGRADQIAVTIGGTEVAALGPAETTVKDVGISAAALAARNAPPVPPQAAPAAAPTARP